MIFFKPDTKMHAQDLGKSSRPLCLLFLLTIFFLSFMSFGPTAAAADDKSTTIIGVVIDEASRVGKEHKTAMKIAVQKFNNSSNHKLIIHFRNIGAGDPFKAATAGWFSSVAFHACFSDLFKICSIFMRLLGRRMDTSLLNFPSCSKPESPSNLNSDTMLSNQLF